MPNNQKPIFNLEDTDLGMYCIVAVVLIFMLAIMIGANRIPDWAALLSFGTGTIGLIATIAVAKLKMRVGQPPEEPAEPIVPTPVRKPRPRKPRPPVPGSGT